MDVPGPAAFAADARRGLRGGSVRVLPDTGAAGARRAFTGTVGRRARAVPGGRSRPRSCRTARPSDIAGAVPLTGARRCR